MAKLYTPTTTETYVSAGDYISTGCLGPVQQVSANRMLRACEFGWLYVGASDWPDCSTIARPLGDRVAFTLVPVERRLRDPSVQARGPSGVAYVATHDQYGERNDFQLWNEAAAALQAASDEATLNYGRKPCHFSKGHWQVGYVGTSGLETIWHACRTIGAGVIGVRRGYAAHFVATHTKGATYRVRVDWGPMREGYTDLEASVHFIGEPSETRPPLYVTRWCLSRCRGSW